MPFLAIAAVIALFVGGGVTVAADQAHPGEALYSYKTHINDNVRHEYHNIRASLSGEAKTEADANADINAKRAHRDSDDTATTTLHDHEEVQSGLRVRADADADAKALDDKINADGSIKVNVF